LHSVIAAFSLVSPLACYASPLVTIHCEVPKGITQRLTQSAKENGAAAEQDGFNAQVTFVVDSSRTKATQLWTETAGEKALKHYGWKAEAAREIPVASFSPEMIVVFSAHAGRNDGAELWTFYPSLGAVFMTQEYLTVDGATASQSAFFAKCEFSWSAPQR
jgi:hypothetical protein